jgi:epoxyqueuosine reductase
MDERSVTRLVKEKAASLGFMFCNAAKAEYMNEEAKLLDKWLNSNHHGEMSYMANHFDLRVDPSRLVAGAKTVISLAYNYHHPYKQTDPTAPKISQYAYGRDYHKVVRKKLNLLFDWMKDSFGEIEGRVFVDSAPILERDWAQRSGLGWVGKNTMTINPKAGSFFFLAEVICDLAMEYDAPIKDYCGTCTRCIDACPTDAISPEGYWMDGSKCISYLTIEYKKNLPPDYASKMEGWMYGCDICQDVCPWNRFAEPHQEPQFLPSDPILHFTKSDWQELSEPMYDQIFEGSAVKRAKYEGLRRNIDFLDGR